MTQPSTEVEPDEVVPVCARPTCERTEFEGDTPFCPQDFTEIVKALRALPELYVRLGFAMVPSSGAGGEKVSGSKTPPLPLRAEVMALQEDLAGMLIGWEDSVRKVEGFTPAGRQLQWTVTVATNAPGQPFTSRIAYDGFDSQSAIAEATKHGDRASLTSSKADEPVRRDAVNHPDMARQMVNAARFLTVALHQLLAGPVGGEAGMDILGYHGKARMMLGLSRGDQQLPMPCPNPDCGQVSLVRKGGTDHIECDIDRGGCGRVESGDRMRYMIRALAVDSPDLLLPSSQAAQFAGVKPSTVTTWVARKKLTPAAVDAKNGRNLFRLGDLFDLVVAENVRPVGQHT